MSDTAHPLRRSLPLFAVAGACLSSEARDLHRRRNEERFAAETTPVPLLTLFALKALLDLEALSSNNVRGGTCLAEAGGVKRSGWHRLRLRAIAIQILMLEFPSNLEAR